MKIFSSEKREEILEKKEEEILEKSFLDEDFESLCGICGEMNHQTNQCYTFKTKICWNWEKGHCKNKDQCIFAHGKDELKPLKEESKRSNSVLLKCEKN